VCASECYAYICVLCVCKVFHGRGGGQGRCVCMSVTYAYVCTLICYVYICMCVRKVRVQGCRWRRRGAREPTYILAYILTCDWEAESGAAVEY
jgi:hypothetical protein